MDLEEYVRRCNDLYLEIMRCRSILTEQVVIKERGHAPDRDLVIRTIRELEDAVAQLTTLQKQYWAV